MPSEDILIRADCTWCYRYELSEMNHMSDDYFVLRVSKLTSAQRSCATIGLT